MLYISDNCEKITGYTPQDLIQNYRISYEQITLEEDRKALRDAIRLALQQKLTFEIEYRIRKADGEIRWVLERGIGIMNPAGNIEALEGYIQDITQRKINDQALHEAEQRYRGIFENAIEGIFQTSLGGQYISANPALAKMYGYGSSQEMIANLNNISKQLYVDPDKRQEFASRMQNEGQVTNFESQIYKRDGSIIWISENARAVRDHAGNILYYEGTVEDITKSKNYHNYIQHQATHDDLTGLPNRVLLKDRLQSAISNARRTDNQLAVVFVDLDQFKDVNDSVGHHIGDRLLIEIAKRLQSCIRETDTVARPGGDEFVLLITNLHDKQALNQTLQRILNATAMPCAIDGLDFMVTCSLGISIYPSDGLTIESLLKNADAAMYKAKQLGKNNFQFFTKELNSILIERLDLEYRMRSALVQQEFVLHYQPKVNLGTQAIVGMEALIRWPTLNGIVSPSKFIPIAEGSNLIEQIGEWVMHTACVQNVKLAKNLGISLPVSVNVSPRQFNQKNLVNSIEEILVKSGLDPACLELEITEGTLAKENSNFAGILKNLKSLGIKLAIDDFGTGYSCMAYLKDLPIDNLKIDQSFVRGIDNDRASRAILKTIVGLGHNLGLNVIAEGVETLSEKDFLMSIGCDEMQGYLFSKAIGINDLTQLLLDSAMLTPVPFFVTGPVQASDS